MSMASRDRHILSVLVENKPGVLARIALMFSRRGYNIHSLAVGPTEDERVSRLTIVVGTEAVQLEQIVKQLNKLVHVLKITELGDDAVERELQLVKVSADPSTRSSIIELADVFRAKVVDVGSTPSRSRPRATRGSSRRCSTCSSRSASVSSSAAARSPCRAVVPPSRTTGVRGCAGSSEDGCRRSWRQVQPTGVRPW
jgi:acetolactate synthase small subunit